MNRLILAALCDLDGVITQTAKIHAQAWKKIFDHFFHRYKQKSLLHHAFDIAYDYPLYIDGKPRMEAIRDYLQSKQITIPMGDDDDMNKDTVHGLAFQKNQIFLQLLETQDIEIYQENVNQLKKWKELGMRLAVVSSSKNCQGDHDLKEGDKGQILQYILSTLDLINPNICPIYLGDNLTAENAFRCLPEQGIGILVGDHGQPTYADFGLNNSDEVEKFLNDLTNMPALNH